MADNKPVIIVKKKGGHGGHHGGAWKVAYADFVTAMMAFFMVMWLVNSAETATKQNIAQYFKRPGIFDQGSGTPLLLGGAGILQDAYVPNRELRKGAKGLRPHPSDKGGETEGEVDRLAGEGKIKTDLGLEKGIEKEKFHATGKQKEESLRRGGERGSEQADFISKKEGLSPKEVKWKRGRSVKQEDTPDRRSIEQLANEVKQMIAGSPELAQLLGIVDIKIENDGLNIEIMDTEKSSMFALGSPVILPEAKEAFSHIAELMAKLPNSIDIIGHTDGKPFSSRLGAYSNWELSSDRANSARKVMEASGILPGRITSVVGRADKDLRKPEEPFAASNRRITLKLKFNKNNPKVPDSLKDSIIDDPIVPPTPQALTEEDLPSLPPMISETPSEEITEKVDLEPAPAPSPLITPDPTHRFIPKNLVKAKRQKSKLIVLPESNDSTSEEESNNTWIQKDKIFGDSPILGVPSPLSGS